MTSEVSTAASSSTGPPSTSGGAPTSPVTASSSCPAPSSATPARASRRVDGSGQPSGVEPAGVRATDRAERRARRQVALARCSPLAAPFLGVWLAVSAVLLAATLLIAKRPRLAWREVADVTALLHPVSIIGARWRGRRSRRLARR